MNQILEIFGIPVVVIGGAVLFVILTFQFLTGLSVIKLPVKYHKYAGIILFCLVFFHIVFGLMLFY